jgi:replicative DNA helicase
MTDNLQIEIERVVLSSIILESRALEIVTDCVEFTEDLFSTDPHKLIARGIIKLTQEEKPVDIMLLADALKKLNINYLDNLPIIAYLVNLHNVVQSTANLEHHTRILSEFAIKNFNNNQLISLSKLELDPLQKLERIESYIYELKNKFFKTSNYDTTIKNYINNLYTKDTEPIKTNTVFDKFGGGLYRCEFGVIAGRPGTGKTAFALYLTRNLIAQGHKVLFISMEMPARLVLLRMLSAEFHISENRLKTNKLTEQERNQIMNYDNKNVFIDDKCKTLNDVLKSIDKHKAKYNIDVVFFDYLQKITKFDNAKNLREDQKLGLITKGLETKAKDLDITITALSQFNRDNKTDRPPILTDLKNSGDIEQDAYFVLALHEQAERKNTLDLIMLKNRNGEKETTHQIGTNFQFMDFEPLSSNLKFNNYYETDKF